MGQEEEEEETSVKDFITSCNWSSKLNSQSRGSREEEPVIANRSDHCCDRPGNRSPDSRFNLMKQRSTGPEEEEEEEEEELIQSCTTRAIPRQFRPTRCHTTSEVGFI